MKFEMTSAPWADLGVLYTTKSEEGEQASQVGLIMEQSRFGREYVGCVGVGAVSTKPQFRREGLVRKSLETFFEEAKEHPEWAVSLLHPFSFPYYRKFGYEKVSYHQTMEMPIQALDMFPRFANFVPVTPELEPALLALYDRFAQGRNMPFKRTNMKWFPKNPQNQLYVRMKDGVATAYISFRVEDHLLVNRMVGDRLVIDEYGFDSPEALQEILGFIRMFDGQMLRVKFTDTFLCPEVDMMLRHYHSIEYVRYPDISAKILNLKAMLEANDYPQKGGRFVLGTAAGEKWLVEYEAGQACVKPACCEADLVCDEPALARVLYGLDPLTAGNIRYMPGVDVRGNVEDLLRAFPTRICGMFEHF